MLKKLIFVLFAVVFITNVMSAQHRTVNPSAELIAKPDSAMVDIITMRDGNELVGFIKGMNADVLTFLPLNGNVEMTVQRSIVKSIHSIPYKKYMEGYRLEHRGASSLFGAHTGFMLPKGEGRYETMGFVVSNMYDYAITKNVMIGAGFFTFLPAFRIKVGGQVAPNINMALGTTIATFPFASVDFSAGSSNDANLFFGSTYGVATFGNPNSFLNVSAGVAYTASSPRLLSTLQIGGFTRFAPKVGLFGEMNVLPDAILINPGLSNPTRRSFVLGNAGLRLMQKNTSWDLGMVGISDPIRPSRVIFFPMVGFKAYVGKK